MKNWIIGLVVVALVGFAGYTYFEDKKEEQLREEAKVQLLEKYNSQQQLQTDGPPEGEGLKIGEVAADFPIETADGEVVHLSDFRGEPVILNFWATWCPPCRAEMPDMQKVYEDTGVRILSANLIETEKSEDHVPQFIEEYGMTFDVYYDRGGIAAQTYRIQPIPTTYFIDSEGVISFIAYGPLNYDMMIQELEKMK